MLISEKNKETIDACRFCWMCRHICPIGNVTGKERHNARGRALSLSMVERGVELTEDIVANVYECALCGACTKECVTGWDPVEFTKAVRLEAVMNGVIPDYINKLIDNIENTGNVYGKTEICSELKSEIERLQKNADILLFLGADARYMSCKSAINAIKLLKKANVSFTVLIDEPDSGYSMDTILGKANETNQIMKKAAETLSRYKTIVAYDPSDAKVFMREYKEWGIEPDSKIKTFTGFIDELIENGSLKPRRTNKTFVFQDPALLARDLEETQEARKILNACGNVKEMLLHGKDTMWAGNLIMNEYMPNVMKLTAEARWENALSTEADVLVSASPSEYEILAKVKPKQMELLSIEEVVLGGLE
jgi:Fe-S oxidoreductase